MNRKTIIAAIMLPIAATIYSCDDGSSIGSTVVEDQVTVMVDSSFTVTGHSVPISKVQSRTVSQLIGRIDANGYGRLSSDVVTQFMPALQLDTANIRIQNIDSLHLVMAIARGEYVGDSIAPLGLEVYELTRQLPSPIYSDFDAQDYYDANKPLASVIYNVSENTSSKVQDDRHIEIKVNMPVDLAKRLYSQYLNDKSAFASPTQFSQIFPGLYIKNSFGSGRLSRVTSTLMTMYYHHTTVNDAGHDTTIVSKGNYFAVTPEIISNNNIDMAISPEVMAKVSNGENIVMAPVGLEVQMLFPAPEIIAQYRQDQNPVKVLNTLSFTLPGEPIANDYGISMPTYLLLVLAKDKDKFFASNKLPDNVTSFYAKYDANTGLYDFGDMRQYLIDLMSRDNISEEDYTFVITSVSATFESTNSSYYYYYYSQPSETLSMLAPYVAAPVMAKLNLDKAKVKMTMSSQKLAR